jgi:hypothetical protein
MEKPITRRTSLVALGGLVAGTLGWRADSAESAGVARS